MNYSGYLNTKIDKTFHVATEIGEEDADDDINTNAASYLETVDSYRLVRRNRKQGQRQNGGGRTNREFCRCKRGPVGYPGAAGKSKKFSPKFITLLILTFFQ